MAVLTDSHNFFTRRKMYLYGIQDCVYVCFQFKLGVDLSFSLSDL
jgi:hypothetical protein